jgi:type II secretion system protein N
VRRFSIRSIVKWSLLGLSLFVLFLVLTFPFSRLGRPVAQMIEQALMTNLGLRASCQIQGLHLSFPLGLRWELLHCKNAQGLDLLQLRSGRVSLLPGMQSFSATWGQGQIQLKPAISLSGQISRISGDLTALSLTDLSPLLGALISRMNPAVSGLLLEGSLNSNFDLPFKNLARASGSLDLQLQNLKLPNQALLRMIGLNELSFKTSEVRAALSSGTVTISSAQFLSEHLSGKAEGTLSVGETWAESTPNIMLKWKVTRSDALMSSFIGSQLVNAPCPTPDSEGFCTQRLQRWAF